MDTLLPVDAETPRSLVLDPPLTDAQFQELCFANDWFRFERTREGEILMHPPTGGSTSRGNADIIGQLYAWQKTHGRGATYDSNGGFFLPDGSMLSPDAAYVLPQKLKGLTKDDVTGLPYLCPDFIIELLSVSVGPAGLKQRARSQGNATDDRRFHGQDSVPKAKQKMERWIENGVALGWLIDPYKKKVYVYEPGREAATVSGKMVQGSGPVEGFTLDLDELWGCYEI